MISPLWTTAIAAGALLAGIAIGLLWTCRDVRGEHSAYAPEFSVAAVAARVRADVVHIGQCAAGAAEPEPEPEPVTAPLPRVSVRLTTGRGQLDPAVFRYCFPAAAPDRPHVGRHRLIRAEPSYPSPAVRR